MNRLGFIVLLLCKDLQSNGMMNLKNFLKNLNKSSIVQSKNRFLLVLIGDCNAKSKNWYKFDKCSFGGNVIENVTSQFCLQPIIKESMHILDNSSSCIFTSKRNLLIESGVHPSMHWNSCHQIIFSKFDLQNFYRLLYSRKVWRHKDTKQ